MDIPAQALRFWLFLRKMANKSLRCWPSKGFILQHFLGWYPSTVARASQILVESRLLKIERQFDGETGAQKQNIYQLIDPPHLKKISERFKRDRSVRGGIKNHTPGVSKIIPPHPPLNRIELLNKELKEKGEGPRPHTPSLPSAEFQNLLGHWKIVYRTQKKVPAPVYARLEWILRDLLRSLGLAGAQAAVDLWFEKSYRREHSTFYYRWADKASEKAHAAEEFERHINAIVQSPRFADLKKKYDGELAGVN